MKFTAATILVAATAANAVAVADPKLLKGKPFRVLCGPWGGACPRSYLEAREAKLLKGQPFRVLCGPWGGACPRDAIPEPLANAIANAADDESIVTRDMNHHEKREAKLLKGQPFRVLCGPWGGACPRDVLTDDIKEALDEANELAEVETEHLVARAPRLLKGKPFRVLCGPWGGACPRDAMPEALASSLDAANNEA